VSEPKRREMRRTHLDASVLPVERALLARAAALEEGGAADIAYGVGGSGGGGGSGYGGGHGGRGGDGGSVVVTGYGATGIGGAGGGGGGHSSVSGPGLLALAVAAEFRSLAEELHWW
jgi:hypothetical protein